jgi:hypothetical protein
MASALQQGRAASHKQLTLMPYKRRPIAGLLCRVEVENCQATVFEQLLLLKSRSLIGRVNEQENTEEANFLEGELNGIPETTAKPTTSVQTIVSSVQTAVIFRRIHEREASSYKLIGSAKERVRAMRSKPESDERMAPTPT